MIELKVLEITTRGDEKVFEAIGPDGKKVICFVHRKEDWSKIEKSIGSIINVNGSLMGTGFFIVLEVI